MKKLIIALSALFYLSSGWALPEQIEFWFFAPPTRALILPILYPFQFSKQLAQNEFDCVPMGDGCFHPQLGFIEGEKADGKPRALGEVKTTPATLDQDLIECQENYAFDLFCGQARAKESMKELPVAGFEVWFDMSASMQAIYNQTGRCLQEQFVERLQVNCKAQLSLKGFQSKVFALSHAREACSYRGSNDGKTLVEELMKSHARKVLVISDTDEYAGELRKFIEQGNYSVKGMGTPLFASSLLSLIPSLNNICL